MALLIALLVLMLFHQASTQSEYGYVNIDCGAEDAYLDDENITWFTDYRYVKQGYNQMINKSIQYDPMHTLRAFPELKKNCYTLPAFIQQKYLLRAGFFYGNYDGLSRPPMFDLQFDANSWATVITSIDQPVFYEAVVMARRHNISVCVARTKQGDVPFISTLQIMQLLPGMYSNMDSDHALFKEYRFNFGSNQTVRYPDDKYGRVWEPAPPNSYTNITADFQTLISTVIDDPPFAAIRTAIQSKLPSDPILLSFKLQEQVRPSYISLYFTEVAKLNPGQNRTFDIYFNGQDYNLKLSPIYQTSNEVHGYVVPTGVVFNFNLSLVPSKNSNMPPIVSAMELFTVSETLANGTAPQDVFGLGLIAHFQESLSKWSGDPCLPVPWDCYLANFSIPYLTNFSDMQALEIIDLQNNSLTGEVPSFIWDFPNLKSLNLAYNNFRGTVPEFIINRKVSLNITGTGLIIVVPKKKKSHTGLIVGVIVAVAVALIGFAAFTFINHCIKRDRKVSTMEMSRVEEENQTEPVAGNGSETQCDPQRSSKSFGFSSQRRLKDMEEN
ncbi:hypothetical protein J5N97_014886 [Dioscorea zingiberensis]|uniref:Malectin-like domain-containing protein n=1 Tax=Dioscorea zingiberensis TaxID=325984 RepID=A0A9D5HKH6_9LILI|nr:hypothetical protein J5N97_014886 [Dioscorea zingiberensis]